MGLLLALALDGALAVVRGWALMLAVGVVHHEWWPEVPAIGYLWAALLALLLSIASFRVNVES